MKNIKEIAEQIIQIEKQYQLTHDSALESKINDLIKNLSLSEMLEIDNYIMESHKLKN